MHVTESQTREALDELREERAAFDRQQFEEWVDATIDEPPDPRDAEWWAEESARMADERDNREWVEATLARRDRDYEDAFGA